MLPIAHGEVSVMLYQRYMKRCTIFLGQSLYVLLKKVPNFTCFRATSYH